MPLRSKSSHAIYRKSFKQVGKRAPQAASHTDTSFKSKRVRVSAQSILHEAADGEAITARGQGVQVRLGVTAVIFWSVVALLCTTGAEGDVVAAPEF